MIALHIVVTRVVDDAHQDAIATSAERTEYFSAKEVYGRFTYKLG